MTTEVLGFLIIVGALIVFVMRRDLWNGLPGKADEVEEASVKMRLQMEHSADEIIARMESRIRHLESLVASADERARVLENQLAAARADQERAAMQAEQRLAAMRAAQDNYYMRGGAMGYMEPDARMAWQDGYYRPEPRSMRPVGQVAPVRRMETKRPRMIAPSDGGSEDFAETLSASMRAEEARHPGEYAQTVYARPEAERYYEAAYDDGYGDEYTYAAPSRAQAPQGAARAVPRRQAAPVMDAEMAPAERAVEETPAAVVESRFASERQPTYEDEPEDEPFFSEEALEELAHTRPEIVVSPSVADVVDLPLDPEDEEDAYAEGDMAREENETASYDETARVDGAYDDASLTSEAQGARLHVAAGGEPLQAEPIYSAPTEVSPGAEPIRPAVVREGGPLPAETLRETQSLASEAAVVRESEEPATEGILSPESGEGQMPANDARDAVDAPLAWKGAASFARASAGEKIALRATDAPSEPGYADTRSRETTDAGLSRAAVAETWAETESLIVDPLAEESATVPFAQGGAAYDTGTASMDGAADDVRATAAPYVAAWEASDAERPAETDDIAPPMASYVQAPAADRSAPAADALRETSVRPEPGDATVLSEAAEKAEGPEDEGTPTQTETAADGANDWLATALTAGAEAADMALFEEDTPDEDEPPVPKDASPADKARELLAKGMTPTDVARETGMGRNAVELLAQMMGNAKSAPVAGE